MVKCYSVRLKSLTEISEKAYKATCWDGSEDIIPKSQVYGLDEVVLKTEAYWISEWILKQKQLQYSRSKVQYFDFRGALKTKARDRKRTKDDIEIIKHTPARVFHKAKEINELER